MSSHLHLKLQQKVLLQGQDPTHTHNSVFHTSLQTDVMNAITFTLPDHSDPNVRHDSYQTPASIGTQSHSLCSSHFVVCVSVMLLWQQWMVWRYHSISVLLQFVCRDVFVMLMKEILQETLITTQQTQNTLHTNHVKNDTTHITGSDITFSSAAEM